MSNVVKLFKGILSAKDERPVTTKTEAKKEKKPLVADDQEKEVDVLKESVDTIMNTFMRDNMKVVFFGR